MSTQVRTQDQYMLRVKRNSEFDRALRALDASDTPLTFEEVCKAGGKARTAWFMKAFAKSIDNLHIESTGELMSMRYVDTAPRVPVAVGTEIISPMYGGVAVPTSEPIAPDAPEINDIRWPQAPPMIESIGEKYRQPAWFNTMKTMVDNGSHIALAGPPGVGKDTAVQELAAREGRILVTVGGDGGFRRRDLVGNLQIANGRSFFDVAEYAAAVINGWWVLLTEVNAADADALLFINAQLAAPYICTVAGKAYSVHPDFRLFVSYNPGLVGTKPLPQSFKDRFFSIKVPFFTMAQLVNILVAHGAPEEAGWVVDIANYGRTLWDAHERGQLRYQVTTRRLMDAVTLIQAGVAGSTREALEMGVVDSIDSPIEAGTAKQILNGISFS